MCVLKQTLQKKIPNRVWIGCGNKGFQHEVIEENKSKYCNNCSRKGHDEETCIFLIQNLDYNPKNGHNVRPKKVIQWYEKKIIEPTQNTAIVSIEENMEEARHDGYLEKEKTKGKIEKLCNLNTALSNEKDLAEKSNGEGFEEDKTEDKIEEETIINKALCNKVSQKENPNSLPVEEWNNTKWQKTSIKIQVHLNKIQDKVLNREDVQVVEEFSLSPKGTVIPKYKKNQATKSLYLTDVEDEYAHHLPFIEEL